MIKSLYLASVVLLPQTLMNIKSKLLLSHHRNVNRRLSECLTRCLSKSDKVIELLLLKKMSEKISEFSERKREELTGLMMMLISLPC